MKNHLLSRHPDLCASSSGASKSNPSMDSFSRSEEVLDSKIEVNYLKNRQNGGKGPSTDQSSN